MIFGWTPKTLSLAKSTSSGDRVQHLRQLVGEDLVDLAVRDDERRRQSNRVTGHPHHEAVVVEAGFHNIVGPLAGRPRHRDDIYAGGDPDGADVGDHRVAL